MLDLLEKMVETPSELLVKPFQSLLRIPEHFDIHAPVHCDCFTEPPWVKQRFIKNVCDRCTSGDSPIQIAYGRFRHELTIVESFDGFGLSNNCPAIDDNSLAFVKSNGLQDFQKCSLCRFHRKLACDNDVEEIRFRMNLRQHAHSIAFLSSQLGCMTY